ncbi:hypothetical protein [Halorientalis persicus]|uniref:hypothetical protein n=1 Tax=Halorientalis persicus TaxID=1367881 RepID=UPI001113CA4A|nr:hypothetical protein [Halorientalis persicus]
MGDDCGRKSQVVGVAVDQETDSETSENEAGTDDRTAESVGPQPPETESDAHNRASTENSPVHDVLVSVLAGVL